MMSSDEDGDPRVLAVEHISLAKEDKAGMLDVERTLNDSSVKKTSRMYRNGKASLCQYVHVNDRLNCWFEASYQYECECVSSSRS